MVGGAYPRRCRLGKPEAKGYRRRVTKHIETFKSWSESIVSDVAALKALIESTAEPEARRLAAGALGYLVTRMDLVPDWEGGIGALDDVMVLRVCAQLAAGHGLGAVAESHEINLSRMANEAERISEFLGGAAYDKLRTYCAKLSETAVRGPQRARRRRARKALFAGSTTRSRDRAGGDHRRRRRRGPAQGVPQPGSSSSAVAARSCKPAGRGTTRLCGSGMRSRWRPWSRSCRRRRRTPTAASMSWRAARAGSMAPTWPAWRGR
jgi:uncharacterized membrane protein YkvA (DUF1232 family)